VPGHPDTGEAALRALEDIHLVRTMLDTAELHAVRTARGHGRSWAEIATTLHLSKQAAWEKWHDLDTDPAIPTPTPGSAV
jgi:hypothetical protein